MVKRILILLIVALFLVGCSNLFTGKQQMMHHDGKRMQHGNQMQEESMRMMEGRQMGEGRGNQQIYPLRDSNGEVELNIPPVLEKSSAADADYEIKAMEGETGFFPDTLTKTYGYNGNLLGPTLRLLEGEEVIVKVSNQLDEPTTFHWHGLEVAGSEDGGPQQEVLPGESKYVTLKADQEAATLWYHPHPHELTAKQVYQGLGAMLYIDPVEEMGLPNDYGINDIPLVIQDRRFDENAQLNYDRLMHIDGTTGNETIINGTMDAKFTVTDELTRFRILNASNARNYTFKLSNGASFTQIAGDGGFLTEIVEQTEITLSPSERAEILIDFSKLAAEEQLALVEVSGAILLPFELNLQTKSEQDPNFINNQGTFLTKTEKALPVSKKVELFGHMQMVTINGKKFDPERIDFTQEQGVAEVWEIYNKPDMMGGMIHPFHIHGTQFKIISRDEQEPPAFEQGLKDSVLIKPGERVKLLVRFPEKGLYMFHCHILEHEDNGMMGQVEVY